jgi:hypothetical protein
MYNSQKTRALAQVVSRLTLLVPPLHLLENALVRSYTVIPSFLPHYRKPPNMDIKHSPPPSQLSTNHLDSEEEEENAYSEDEQSGVENRERPRKRQRRPMSVSCELCKQRKVCGVQTLNLIGRV